MNILVVILLITPVVSYELKCPAQEQWSFRSQKCSAQNRTHPSYYCLLDLSDNSYKEQCDDYPARGSEGYRKVFAGSLHSIVCGPEFYQPIKFWTNVSSGCIFLKSLCNEEGQVVHSDGSNLVDRQCRCDYHHGYTYVNKPKNRCYCKPAEEDCTCYKITCPPKHLLSPDYECRHTDDWKLSFNCPDITTGDIPTVPPILLGKDVTEGSTKEFRSKDGAVTVLVMLIIIFIGFAVIIHTHMRADKGGIVVITNEFTNQTGDIPQNIRELQQHDIIKWKEKLQKFVPTRAADALVDSLRENQCVIVTGPLGCGKTITAQYVTMLLSEEADGYNLLIIADPNDIIRYSKAAGKQLIFIDDIFGKYTVDSVRADWWKLQWATIQSQLSRNGDLRIIATCRSHVFNLADPRIQFSEVDFLSEVICLNKIEKRKIERKYLGADIEGLDDLIMEFDFFPKLCSYIPQDDGQKELHMAYISFETDLLYQNVDVTFLLFSLVVIEGNSIKLDSLRKEIQKNKTILGLCQEIGFKCVPDEQLMMKYLVSLRGSFFVEVNNQFSFKTEKLFEVIFLSISRHILKSLLQYGKWSVLKDHTVFESLSKNEAPPGCVLIPKGYEDIYFDRVLKDIKSGIFWEIFTDTKNKIEEYRVMFLRSLREHFTCQNFTTDKNGNTILHVVADQGYGDYLEFFADLDRSRINSTDNKGRTPLHLASRGGHTSVTEILIRRIHRKGFIDVTDNDGNTPLHLACEGGHKQTVFKLLSNKAAIKQNPSTLVSALHLVCKSGHKAIASMLIRNNAEVNAIDENRNTPLHFASANSHKDICDLLLTNGANPNLQDSRGRTPLYRACENDCVDVVQLLLENNADPCIDERVSGKTLLHIACENGHIKTISKLLDIKVDINKQDINGNSSLYLASMNGHLEVVKTLLSNKANVNLSNNSQNTPLHVASARGCTDIVCCFLDKDADVNCANVKKYTPLHIACEVGHSEIVKILLNRRADVNAVNDQKLTPVHLACQRGHEIIIEMLK